MNLPWLIIALIGLGLLVWAIMQSMQTGERRKGLAPLIGAGAMIFGLGVALSAALPNGLEIPGGSMTHMGAMKAEAMVEGIGFTSPFELEKLDLQDFLITGKGKAGEELELYEGGNKLGQFTVGKDGTWSWPIGGALVTEGDHTYELRAVGAEMGSKLTVNIAKGRPTASNAQCPCRLRITSLEKQNVKDAAITLFKDGKVVEVGADPQVFGNLAEGEYTYSVTAPGFETFSSGKARAPKNKNISVYLKPAKK
jgi:hypothetical protein